MISAVQFSYCPCQHVGCRLVSDVATKANERLVVCRQRVLDIHIRLSLHVASDLLLCASTASYTDYANRLSFHTTSLFPQSTSCFLCPLIEC